MEANEEIKNIQGKALAAIESNAAVLALLPFFNALNVKIDALGAKFAGTQTKDGTGEHGDGWLDAKSAAKYMDVSASTFDKYRYKTTPTLKGFNLEGKTLYKKADIDSFVRLYAIKNP